MNGGANFGVVLRVVTQVNCYSERVPIIQRGPIRCAFIPPIQLTRKEMKDRQPTIPARVINLTKKKEEEEEKKTAKNARIRIKTCGGSPPVRNERNTQVNRTGQIRYRIRNRRRWNRKRRKKKLRSEREREREREKNEYEIGK